MTERIVIDVQWVATGEPNVIAASGYPVQIERRPDKGDFFVTGYGRSDKAATLSYAQWVARSWIVDQIEFNQIAGIE